MGDKQDCFKIYLPDLLLVSVKLFDLEARANWCSLGVVEMKERRRWRNGDHPKQIKVRLNGPSCRQLRPRAGDTGARVQNITWYFVKF